MVSTVIGGAMLPHAPQFFTMPETEDKQNVERVRAVAREIGRQAQMMAFVDLFWFIGLFTFAILPLLLLMKKPTREGVFIPAHV